MGSCTCGDELLYCAECDSVFCPNCNGSCACPDPDVQDPEFCPFCGDPFSVCGGDCYQAFPDEEDDE